MNLKSKLKRVFGLALIMIMAIFLSGCVKYNVNMGVNPDKSVDIEIIYAMEMSTEGLVTDDDDDTEESETTTTEEVKVDDYSFLKSKGYTVEEYQNTDSEGNKVAGVKIKKKFASIDAISKETEKTIDMTNLFKDEKNFDDSQFYSKKGNTYKASFLFDFRNNGQDASETYADYQSLFDLVYTITLPVKADSNNATKVSSDGKTLTWEMPYGKVNKVEYSFTLDGSSSEGAKDSTGDNAEAKEEKKKDDKNSSSNSGIDEDTLNLIIYIAIGAGFLIVVVVVVIVILSKKKKNTPTE